MADYVLDTNHLSYFQEGHPKVVRRFADLLATDRLFTTVVSVGELLRGVYLLPRGRKQRRLLELYHEAVGHLSEVLPITVAVAERFAQTDVQLRRKGRPIPANDIWVAAVVLVRGAVLVTNDDHFSYIDHLRTEDWTR